MPVYEVHVGLTPYGCFSAGSRNEYHTHGVSTWDSGRMFDDVFLALASMAG